MSKKTGEHRRKIMKYNIYTHTHIYIYIHIYAALTVWLRSFFIPFRGTEIIFYIPSPGTEFFSFLLWHRLLWYSCFPGWELKLFPYLQYRVSVYTLSKAENQEIQFPLLYTKPIKDKHKFFLSKVGSSGADLSANRATIVESSGSNYRSTVPIRQDFWSDLPTNRSQMVKANYVWPSVIKTILYCEILKRWIAVKY